MSFIISGLPIEQFRPLFSMSDTALAEKGVVRKIADAKPGYPCRISLEDAEPGDQLLLMHYENHRVQTPYRSAYAIYINEAATEQRIVRDSVPGALQGRPIALRVFNETGMLINAALCLDGNVANAIETAFETAEASYIHLHNAAHGCFAAEARPALGC